MRGNLGFHYQPPNKVVNVICVPHFEMTKSRGELSNLENKLKPFNVTAEVVHSMATWYSVFVAEVTPRLAELEVSGIMA